MNLQLFRSDRWGRSATEEPREEAPAAGRLLLSGGVLTAAPVLGGTPALTWATCWPQPDQVILPQALQVLAWHMVEFVRVR